ncbi:MAG: DUF1877 family protein [Bradyrhizobium sp.]|uniref:DUF1877 family protein n=1 Tax=Bradyrhizobium sp. TaxID=376 RepID=UPI001E028D92|nr:DUF1877 family protein [Bradyrhizobium sp.]MBV9563800.1 DUF1877 family protein [Bradyrhizobium sp.]
MGAMMYVCRIDATSVGRLLSHEKSSDEYFSACHASRRSESDDASQDLWIDLDKAWAAIQFLLTDGREDTALPGGALLGGTAVRVKTATGSC